MASARTAFTAALLLDRRQQGGAAPITAVAVDSSGQRLWLGLEDGVLEEHAILHSDLGVSASLAARKHACKKAITRVLPVASGHSLLVLLSEDGLVQLVDCDSLEAQALPLRHVLAVCVSAFPGSPAVYLAAALKPGKRMLRFVVFELLPPASSVGALPLPLPRQVAQADVPDSAAAVGGLAWVGPHLAVAAGMRYLLVSPFGAAAGGAALAQWQEVVEVPQELAYAPPMLQALPALGRVLMLVGPAGIVVDATGAPVGSAVPLEAALGGAAPRALAASGAFLLVVSEVGIHVFDQEDTSAAPAAAAAGGEGMAASAAAGQEVQRLEFGPTLRPLPGQPLHAAAAAAAAGDGCGCVAVAGRRVVWLYLPVLPADQVRELLGRRDYAAAGPLLELGLRQGAPWAQVAAAQAALLLLHECRFEEATAWLERCSPSTFQPSQLFLLFPTYTAAWAQQVASHQQYWGLHAPLPSLEALISRCLQRAASSLHRRHQRHPGSSHRGGSRHSPPSLSASPSKAGSYSSSRNGGGSLFALEEGSLEDGTESPASMPGTPVSSASRCAGASAALEAAAAAGQAGGLQLPTADAQQQLATDEQQQEQQQEKRRRLQRAAWQSLAQYLLRVRMLEGVACLEGVDTLLLLLLAELGDARQVAAFAAVRNAVDLAAVQPRLEGERWHHALATLHASRGGGASTALHIWRQLADGSLAAAPADPGVHAAERQEALESAAALLRDPAACSEQLLLECTPWLLAASPPAALAVLAARRLAAADVLPLLPPHTDARWQYLAHLLESDSALEADSVTAAATDPALHTELATLLAAAILRAAPELRAPHSPTASGGRRISGGGGTPRCSSSAGGGAAVGSRRRASRASAAALGSGGSLEPGPGCGPVLAMRLRLRRHLEQSPLYDREAVQRALAEGGLQEELVVLHCKAGDHMAALRVLALTLRDVAAAEAYARAHLSPPDYRALLQLVLHPGPGLEPLWDDACYLIAALGDHLDTGEVLAALPPGMPLRAAAGVLAPMLRDRLHRRRQGTLARALQRALLAAATTTLSDVRSGHVVLNDQRACPHCHLRLGGRVFVLLPPGVLPRLVAGAAGGGGVSGGAAAHSSSNRNQQQQQQGEGDDDDEGGGLRPPGTDRWAVVARRLQRQLTSGQEPQAVCLACYRRLSPGSSVGIAGRGGSPDPAGGASGDDEAVQHAAMPAPLPTRIGW